MKYKLAILTSHPIQYQTPLFKKLARHPQIDLMVYFCCDDGLKEKKDPGFGVKFSWDIPLLDGYKYKFLKNWSLNPGPNFWGQINPEIIRELRDNKFEAIIIHGWNSITNWLVFLSKVPIFRAKRGKHGSRAEREVHIFLRAESPLNQELSKSARKIKIKKIILKRLFKKIKSFLFIGQENREFYKFYGVPEERLFFTPYGVDNERLIKSFYQLKDKKNELKRNLGINPNKVVILFVGKLIEKKRPLDLLLAYEKIKIENKCLVYVGDGHLRADMENYIKNKNLKDVYLKGFKNQTELPKYYTLADIFVLPSGMGETWGLVVNEAMCFKLPVIVSDLVGCAKDLVKHGENGYIYPLGNVDKLAEYSEDLVKNKKKREKFGEQSFKLIQTYNYKKDIEGILKALNSL